ncbi:MAG: response regulator [Magnetococcales bacterium]|nr:response regulator [Magnetococcales bacterium]
MNRPKRPRILIVDDKPANLLALHALLSGMDAEILEANSGNEALGLMLEHEFALVLLDVDMPGMDGFEVARMAHKLEQTRNLPILFVTAACKDEFHRLQGYHIGAVDYIEKPINDIVLQAKVALFLNLYNARTESERLRQELLISEERFKFALDGSDEGVWDWDIPSGHVYFSPRWISMLGYGPDEIEPHVRSWERLLHPDDMAAVMSDLDLHLSGLTPIYQTEHRLRTKKGGWLWVLDRGKVVVRAKNGTALRAVGTHHDISRRKQMEEEIRQGKQRYEELTTRIPVGVYTFRYSTRGAMSFDFISDPFCQLLGLEREALLKDVSLAFRAAHPDDQEEFKRLALEVAGKSTPFSWLGRFTVSGQIRWLQIQSIPHVESNGDSIWDGVVIDQTERKVLENALRDSKQEAERANRAKSRFLATMSHEIRTPMNTILGMGEMLRESPRLSPRERQFVQIANRAGDALLALIHDILDLSKIEAGQLRLEQTLFSPEAIIHQAMAMVQEDAKNKGIELSQKLDPDLPRQVRGDPQRLRQILLNLLGNAVKFTQRGWIRLLVKPVDAQIMQFAIQDTGIGIAQERLEAIFLPFMQAEESTTRRFGGTGLGLNICQQLVNHMGGRIWVESRLGAGSTFYFTLHLPSVEAFEESATPDKSLPLPSEQRAPHISQTRRILLVDDTEDNRMVVAAFLEGEGVQLIEADSGAAALNLFSATRFDLVFMDIMMPGMDGLETTRRIRTLEQARGSRRTPVIALTANAMKEDVERSRAAGCDLHLSKPVRRSELMEVIHLYLDASVLATPPLPLSSHSAPFPQTATLVLDGQVLAHLKDETGRGFVRILEMFLKNLPGRLDGLQVAWESRDFESMRQVAHKLKGTASTFGAMRFAALCAELEQQAVRDAVPDQLQERLLTLKSAGQEVHAQLQEILQEFQLS